MTIDTARLRALAEAATPGPWEAGETLSGKGKVLRGGVFSVCNTTAGPYSQQRADAAYIAAASPDTILALLDALDVLRRDVHILVQQRDNALADLKTVEATREAERDALDAAERERDKAYRTADALHKVKAALADERDALAALLRDCRDECEAWTPDESLATADESDALNGWYALRDRIDAALAARGNA